MVDRREIREGMTVKSLDGHKLGKVTATQEDTFFVEKGFFFPREYVASYQEISTVRDGEIILGSSSNQLRSAWGADTGETAEFREERREPERQYYDETGKLTSREEVTVPVTEEELEVTKREREAGAVRVTKDVVTEEKSMKVPVTHEEVHVERVARPETELKAGERAFEEGEVTVPVYEEEVEIRKRPVVKEEVRISKEARTGEEEISETLRRERVKVDDTSREKRGSDLEEPRPY